MAKKTAAKKTAAKKAAPKRAAAVAASASAKPKRAADGAAAPRAATAHRPSRRHVIVDAAITVFGRKGFQEASIQEIADVAGMAPTAVFYHFAGKEDLFETALRRAMESADAVVSAARPDDQQSDASAFADVMLHSWDWIEEDPDAARLLFLHMPGGATPGARALTRAYIDRHIHRAYDYLEPSRVPASQRSAAAVYAARTLAMRTMIEMSYSIHPLRMEGGPFAHLSRVKLRQAVADVSARIIEGA